MQRPIVSIERILSLDVFKPVALEQSARNRQWFFAAACCALVLFGVIRSALATRLDSFTIDEAWHLTAGVAYARTGDFRMNPEHPPLVKLWVGAALSGQVFQLPSFRPFLDKPDEREFVDEAVYLKNDAQAVQRRARWAMLGFHALLLFAFGWLARRVFGAGTALAALALLVIDPTVAAHLPVVMTDLPIALLSSITMLAAIVAFRSWRARDLALVAVFLGLALTAKHSALITVLAVVIFGGVKAIFGSASSGFKPRARRLGAVAATVFGAFVILWSFYGFRFNESSAGLDVFNRPLAEKINDLKSPLHQRTLHLAARTHLLPRAYLWGLADIIRAGVEGRGVSLYFFGKEYRHRTPWHFFSGVLLVKLPLGSLALVALGATLVLLRKVPREQTAPLAGMLGLAALFLLFLARSNAGYAGVRHALAVVPPLALLGALAIKTAFAGNARWLRGAAALAVAAALLSALPVLRPWEYYNELVGGARNAHRYFNDEGLDLGQRTEELVRYYETHLRPAGEIPFDEYGLSKRERERRALQTQSWDDEEPDTNVIRGTVFFNAGDLAPHRIFDFTAFRQARPVARYGNLLIYRGEFHLPWLRASKRLWRAMDALYSQNRDAAKAEQLLTEAVALYPQAYPAALELGNLLLERGARAEAINAYQIAKTYAPADEEIVGLLARQIERVETATSGSVPPLRNPWLE